MLEAMVDDIPPVRMPSGQRRHRPGKLDADKGYDSAANRAWLRRRGIRPRIARRGIESSTRLGRHRWRVERALSWLSCYPASGGALGPGFGAVVRVGAAGLRPHVLQGAVTTNGGRRNPATHCWRNVHVPVVPVNCWLRDHGVEGALVAWMGGPSVGAPWRAPIWSSTCGSGGPWTEAR
jgi:hypothetical protein